MQLAIALIGTAVAQIASVAGVIGLHLVISPIWLEKYRFGPAEWLWRSLTYWKGQPMRRDQRC